MSLFENEAVKRVRRAPAVDARHVFATTVEELKHPAGGVVSYAPADGQTPQPGRLAAKAV